MDNKKKIKIWLLILLITLSVAGGAATILSKKTNFFKGDIGMIGPPPPPPPLLINQSSIGGTQPTSQVTLFNSTCETIVEKNQCINNCSWNPYQSRKILDGIGNESFVTDYRCETKPQPKDTEPGLSIVNYTDFKGEVIPGTTTAVASFFFKNVTADDRALDIAVERITLKKKGTSQNTELKSDQLRNLLFVKDLNNFSDPAKEIAEKKLLTSPLITTVAPDGTLEWTSQKGPLFSISKGKTAKISVLAKISDTAEIGKDFMFTIEQGAVRALYPFYQKYATVRGDPVFPVTSTTVTVVKPEIVAPKQPPPVIPEVTVSVSSDTPKGKEITPDKNLFTAAKLQFIATGHTEISTISVSPDETLGNDLIDLSQIDAIQVFSSTGGNQEKALSSEQKFDTVTRKALFKFAQPWIIDKPDPLSQFFVIKIRLKAGATPGKKFSFGIKTAGDIVLAGAGQIINKNIPAFANVWSIAIPPPPPPPPGAKAALTVTADLPDNQETSIEPKGTQTIKAIKLDIIMQGGDQKTNKLKKLIFAYTGSLDQVKINDPHIFTEDDSEFKAATVTKNPVNGTIEIVFQTTGDAVALLNPQQSFIIYIKATLAQSDGDKKIQYTLTKIDVTPDEASQKSIRIPGPIFTVLQEKAKVLPPPPPPPPPPPAPPPPPPAPPPPLPPPPKLTCEQQGKYTFRPVDKQTVGVSGMCIACPTYSYIQNGGTCEKKQIYQRGASLGDDTSSGSGPNNTTNYQSISQNTQNSQSASAGSSSTANSGSASNPNLQQSQRLVRAPERGNAGPEALVYIAILAVVQSGLWIGRRRKK